jgi:hypothetical protein
MTTILDNRKLHNVVEHMKEEHRKITHKLQSLQDESLRVLEGLTIEKKHYNTSDARHRGQTHYIDSTNNGGNIEQGKKTNKNSTDNEGNPPNIY